MVVDLVALASCYQVLVMLLLCKPTCFQVSLVNSYPAHGVLLNDPFPCSNMNQVVVQVVIDGQELKRLD